MRVTVRKQSPIDAAPTPAPSIRPNELNDELIRRGLDYATKRTPGIWRYNVRGEIISFPNEPGASNVAPTPVAHVTEKADGISIADTTFIVEAVNHYPLALVEIQNVRNRERMREHSNDDRPLDASAEDIRRELRTMISRAMSGNGQIDARDLYAIAEMPIVEIADEDIEPEALICVACGKYNPRALQSDNASIRGPVRICECKGPQRMQA